MPPHTYREFYGIQLLDDLHNYFPALLYAPENFVSVRDVLLYIRTRTGEEMNLFTMGQHDYNNTRVRNNHRNYNNHNNHNNHNNYVNINNNTNRAAAAQTTYRYNTPARQPQTAQPAAANIRINRTTIPVDGTDSSVNMLASLFTLFSGDSFYDNLDPVVVRPSAQQLTAGTEVYVAGENRTECSVCLELPAIGAEMRKLRACGHCFHRRCIDIWFQQNVHCPVCRHDIREPATE